MHDRTSALDALNRQIESLEDQLRPLLQQRKVLENEISLLPSTQTTVWRFPVEILLVIFSILQRDGSSDIDRPSGLCSRLRTVRLTCKKWNDIIVDSPSFWTTIRINGNFPGDHRRWLFRHTQYNNLCIERSRQTPLDIELNFINDLPFHRVQAAMPFCAASDASDWCWLYREILEASPMATSYRSICIDLVKAIIGEGGCHMKGWRSLTLQLPQEEKLTHQIWNLFGELQPPLQNLHIHTYEYLHVGWQERRSFISMPFLRSLKLNGYLDITHAPTSPNIEELTLVNFERWESLDHLRKFTKLRKLVLVGEEIDEEDISFVIPLPGTLRELCMGATIPEAVMHSFAFDQLPQLTLGEIRIRGRDYWDPLPICRLIGLAGTIFIRTIEEEVDHNGSFNATYFDQFLSGIFTQANIVERIGVTDFLAELAVKEASRCREEGFLPHLKRIVLIDRRDYIIDSCYATFSEELEDVQAK